MSGVYIPGMDKDEYESLCEWARIGANNAMIGRKLCAADVQPVKRGYIKTAKKDDSRRCSECRSDLTLTMYSIPDNPAGELLVTTPRFCPHCGAKLDLREEKI